MAAAPEFVEREMAPILKLHQVAAEPSPYTRMVRIPGKNSCHPLSAGYVILSVVLCGLLFVEVTNPLGLINGQGIRAGASVVGLPCAKQVYVNLNWELFLPVPAASFTVKVVVVVVIATAVVVLRKVSWSFVKTAYKSRAPQFAVK